MKKAELVGWVVAELVAGRLVCDRSAAKVRLDDQPNPVSVGSLTYIPPEPVIVEVIGGYERRYASIGIETDAELEAVVRGDFTGWLLIPRNRWSSRKLVAKFATTLQPI